MCGWVATHGGYLIVEARGYRDIVCMGRALDRLQCSADTRLFIRGRLWVFLVIARPVSEGVESEQQRGAEGGRELVEVLVG